MSIVFIDVAWLAVSCARCALAVSGTTDDSSEIRTRPGVRLLKFFMARILDESRALCGCLSLSSYAVAAGAIGSTRQAAPAMKVASPLPCRRPWARQFDA